MSIDIKFAEYQLAPSNPINLTGEIDPSTWEVSKAIIGRSYQPFIDFVSNLNEFSGVEMDMDYNPVPDMEGYEQFFDTLVMARNSEHMSVMKDQLDANIHRREVLEHSSFSQQLVGGILDPINLVALPFGGPTVGIGRSFVRGALGVGILSAGQEAINYPFDPLATPEEAGLNIGFSTVTGGLLSSAISIPITRRSSAMMEAERTHKEFLEAAGVSEDVSSISLSELAKAESRDTRPLAAVSDDDIRVARDAEEKRIFGINSKLEEIEKQIGEIDPSTWNVSDLDKFNELERQANVLRRAKYNAEGIIKSNKRELALRSIEDAQLGGTDKIYDFVGGAYINSPLFKFITTPYKRQIQSKIAPVAKKVMHMLGADSGLAIVANKLGLSLGSSVYQKAKIMEGEWVVANRAMTKLWADILGQQPMTPLGINVTNVIQKGMKLGDKIYGQESALTYGDWLKSINRKRVEGVQELTNIESQAIDVMNKYYKVWEERFEDIGVLGSRRSIEKKVKTQNYYLNDFRKKLAKQEKARAKLDAKKTLTKEQKSYRDRIDEFIFYYENRIMRGTQAVEEMNLELEVMSRSVMPVNEDVFMPRYWDVSKIKGDREGLEKIIAKWYTENPVVWNKVNGKWSEQTLNKDPVSIAERASQTVDKIIGVKDVLDPESITYGAGKSKHLRHRELDIPNKLVFDYMVQDPIAIMKAYNHKSAGVYQFHKIFDGRTQAEVLDDIEEQMLIFGNSRSEINSYRRDFNAMYRRIVGSTVDSFDRIDYKVATTLKDLAYMNYLGGAGISAIPDFAKVIMEHELGDVLKGLFSVLDRNSMKLNTIELDKVGEGIDILAGSAHNRFSENITNNPLQNSYWDQARSAYSIGNLLGPFTVIAKNLDGLLRGHTLVKYSKKVANQEATEFEVTYLARYNIDNRLANVIAKAPVQKTKTGLYLPNTSEWHDAIEFPNTKADIETGPTGRTRKDGSDVAAYYDVAKNKITIDEDHIRDVMWDAKAWENPRVGGVKPIEDGIINSPTDLVSFIKMHEIMHSLNRPQNLDLFVDGVKLQKYDGRKKAHVAAYENAINDLTIKKFKRQNRIPNEDVETFRTAVQSGILNTVLMGTPADKPIISDGVVYVPHRIAKAFGYEADSIVTGYSRVESGLLGMPFQFMSFSFAAMNKITGSYAQGQIKNRAAGIISAMGLGYLAIKIKTPDWAWDDMDDSDKFIRAFDQSGIAALYSDLMYISMSTSMALGYGNPLEGVVAPKFPQEQSKFDAFTNIAGAGIGIGADLTINPIVDFINGDYGKGIMTFIRNLPFARMWFWKDDMNEVSRALSNRF